MFGFFLGNIRCITIFFFFSKKGRGGGTKIKVGGSKSWSSERRKQKANKVWVSVSVCVFFILIIRLLEFLSSVNLSCLRLGVCAYASSDPIFFFFGKLYLKSIGDRSPFLPQFFDMKINWNLIGRPVLLFYESEKKKHYSDNNRQGFTQGVEKHAFNF